MKLQLALDDLTLENAVSLVQAVREYVDIIEIGSPMIIEEGMQAVRKMRELFPEKEILADTKIADAGFYEAELTFKAGADYCTVIGMTDILTVKGCVEAGRKYGKKVFTDMICVEDPAKRVAELEDAGVDAIAVHVGVDQQAAGLTPLSSLKEIKAASRRSVISVAGGINSSTAELYRIAGADIVVVGSGITHAEDPVMQAKMIYEAVNKK